MVVSGIIGVVCTVVGAIPVDRSVASALIVVDS